jgi:hypothetical protein
MVYVAKVLDDLAFESETTALRLNVVGHRFIGDSK